MGNNFRNLLMPGNKSYEGRLLVHTENGNENQVSALHLFIPPWWWFSYIISCCKIKLRNAMKLTIAMPRFCLVFLIYLVITHLTTWSFLRDTRNYETYKEEFLHSVIVTKAWPQNDKYIVFPIQCNINIKTAKFIGQKWHI